MGSQIGSYLTGTKSVLVGQGSALTASGVCAPFPRAFLTDGASFLTGGESLLTATTPLACGGGDCTPGQVLYDVMLSAEMTIASDSVTVGPTWGVYEIPGFGPFPDCTNFQIQITTDLKVTGGGASVWAYLNVSGLDLESRAFAGFHPPYNLAMAASEDTGIYETEVYVDVNGFVNTFVDFAGPLPAQSVYFWVPPKPPGFDTATYLIKNVHIRIVTI